MMRNMDTRIAVARNPKEIAFMDVPKSFQEASLSVVPDGVGFSLHNFGLSSMLFIAFCLLSLATFDSNNSNDNLMEADG